MKFDKNTLSGFLLMILLLVGFMYYNTKQQHESQLAEQQRLDSLAKVEVTVPPVQETDSVVSQVEETLPDSVVQALQVNGFQDKYGILSASAQGESDEVIMENKLVKLTL